MLGRLADRLGRNPRISDFCRSLLEAGFRGEKMVIRERLDPRARTIDVGCGTGTYAGCFEAGGYLGVDINEPHLEHARRKFPGHRFQKVDGVAIGSGDASFDQALICGVLHHCPDDIARAILAETRRLLLPAGRLLLMEDVPSRSKANLIGRAVHALDLGRNIRPAGTYEAIFDGIFGIQDRFEMRSGVCDYACWMLEPVHPGERR